jgi:hypothetical protein
MKKTFYLLSILLVICLTGSAQTYKELKQARDYFFLSKYGYLKSQPKGPMTFCLLGNGYTTAKQSPQADSMIKDWIMRHPNATVVHVTATSPPDFQSTDLKTAVFTWVVDKSDTLNLYLLRQGCFTAESMRLPKPWEKMTEAEKQLFKQRHPEAEKPKTEILLDAPSIQIFMQRIVYAEAYAKKKKLGIWKEEMVNTGLR